tara:strand:- start:86 stop:622 length:537 start_codon:yes stop_codon:yes gene_type:complete
MNYKLLFIISLLLIVGCSQEPINIETLVERDGVFYTKDTNEPYSGSVFSLDKNGRNKLESILEDGKMISYKNLEWWDDGQKRYEVIWKDGKKDLLSTFWYENGQKRYEKTYKDGLQDGLETWWYENGQKRSEGTYKDGKLDGLFTLWYENGQKETEVTYEDGEEISEKNWNEDGIVIE